MPYRTGKMTYWTLYEKKELNFRQKITWREKIIDFLKGIFSKKDKFLNLCECGNFQDAGYDSNNKVYICMCGRKVINEKILEFKSN